MISILMPIKNGISYISESVESVLNQTYTKWELIIGINGLPAESFEYNMAMLYANNYSNIRVIDLPEITGKANALNAMLAHCRYNYVAILDVDDIWLPNKLELQMPYLINFDVVGSQCVYFGDVKKFNPPIPLGNISNFNFKLVNPVINSSAIIRKELCHWNENGVEDYDMWLRLRKQKKTFYNCEQVLVKHRIHRDSAFNSKGNNTKVADLLAMHSDP